MNNIEITYLGIQVAAKELNIPLPEVYIIDENSLGNKEITGTYSFRDNSIIFNEDWVNRREWIEVIITSFHEMRHAYQGYCIRTQSREPQSTLDKWEYETLNYIMPSCKNNEIDDESYLKQEIEIDAIAFVHKMMSEHFKVKTVIPKMITDEVKNFLNM